jgi:predicted nucleic-acid-binding protein
MIGIDTNALLRLFTTDSPEQMAATNKLIGKRGPSSIRLTNLVVAELVWTLVRHYKQEKKQIIDIVEQLLEREELVFESRSAVMMALRWFEGGKADFADYLIGALNEEAGASPTYTFDHLAAGHIGFSLIEP